MNKALEEIGTVLLLVCLGLMFLVAVAVGSSRIPLSEVVNVILGRAEVFPNITSALPLFAFGGAALACVLIYFMAWSDGVDPVRIILSGVAVNAVLGGFNSFLQLQNSNNLSGVLAFMNGSLSGCIWQNVQIMGIYAAVGLVAPHIARMLVGSDYKVLMPTTMLTGSLMVLLADTVGRSIWPGTEIPVGVMMSVFGGPFFLYMLRKRGRFNGN